MTKTTQATIFRKRQILPARGLNKALQEYGSVDGVVPFKADGTQDTSMTAPLGTKAAPFGNAHFKGFNLYTQLEVQQMVENGVLGSADRFVFWNLDTNNLSAWNGTEIIHLGGNGGGNSMDYLFGDGRDGDVTMVANGSFNEPKNFTSFTLNEGITLTHSNTPGLLIIRCKEICKINGIINMDGKGFLAGAGYSSEIPAEWPGGLGISVSADTVGRGASCGGTCGKYSNRGNPIYGATGSSVDYSKHLFFAQQLKFERIPLLGGGGASNEHVTGGTGGGGILIFAPIIQFGANSVLRAKGNSGTTATYTTSLGAPITHNAGGGGGGGGTATLVAQSIVGTPEISFTGGASVNNSGAGGDGCIVKVIVP